MNFDEAIQKHSEWKVKLRSAINKQEQLDAATIAKDNCCPVGQWLHGAGKSQFGGKPEFKSAVDQHRQFHTEAGKVAHLINAKKYADADKALGSDTPYGSASTAVALALRALKRVANA